MARDALYQRRIQSNDVVGIVLLAGLAGSVFAFLYGQPYRLEQYDLPKEFALGIVGIASSLYLLGRQVGRSNDALDLSPVAALAWGACVTPIVAASAIASWRTLGAFAVALAVFIVARDLGRRDSMSVLRWALVVVLSLMAVLVLLEAYGGLPFFSVPGRRPGATLGNRNLAARLACFGLLLVWDRLAGSRKHFVSAGLTVAAAVFVCMIALARSRNAIIVSHILLLILPVLSYLCAKDVQRHQISRAVLAWSVAFIVGWGSALLIPNRMAWGASDIASSLRRIGEYQEGTGRGRVIQATTTLRMIGVHPFVGVGAGNWSVQYPAYAAPEDPSVMLGAYYPGPQIPRNDVLALVAEWGLIGAVPLLVAAALFTRKIGGLLSSPITEVRHGGVLACGCGVAVVTLGVFDSVLRVPSSVLLVSMIFGLALGTGNPTADTPSNPSGPLPRLFWRAVWGWSLVLSFLLARSAIQDIRALRVINSLSSLRDLERAVAIAPNNVEARALLAYLFAAAGRCDLADPHLRQAALLQPHSDYVSALRGKCGLTANAQPG